MRPFTSGRRPDTGGTRSGAASKKTAAATRRKRRRLSLAGFKDPTRRPRYIVLSGVVLLVLAAVVIVGVGVSSTRWFCANACHQVQDDTITAYNRSSHSEVGCYACHMPTTANPVSFMLHKAENILELGPTISKTFELPLNAESHLALEMDSRQCIQCHDLKKRPVTPTTGVSIDHDVHERAGVGCTVCHNRIAHNEDFELKLKDPQTGKPNRRHEVFTSMTACFRCHEQGGAGKAPGTCSACHTKGFELRPASHLDKAFYPTGHAQLAKEEMSRTPGPRVAEVSAESSRPHAAAAEDMLELPPVSSIDYCSTCHEQSFCSDCHGVEMPHPAAFKQEHGRIGKSAPKACVRCHGSANRFCDDCHHGTSLQIPYTTADGPWVRKHPQAVTALGPDSCFGCHDPTYCAHCHVRGIGD